MTRFQTVETPQHVKSFMSFQNIFKNLTRIASILSNNNKINTKRIAKYQVRRHSSIKLFKV